MKPEKTEPKKLLKNKETEPKLEQSEEVTNPFIYDLHASTGLDILPNSNGVVKTSTIINSLPKGCIGLVKRARGSSRKIDVFQEVVYEGSKEEVKLTIYNYGKDLVHIRKGDLVGHVILVRYN